MNKLDVLKVLSEMKNFYRALDKNAPTDITERRSEALDLAIKCVSKMPEPIISLDGEEDPNWAMHSEDRMRQQKTHI